MAARNGRHTCACKWWKWVGNSTLFSNTPARLKPSEARYFEYDLDPEDHYEAMVR